MKSYPTVYQVGHKAIRDILFQGPVNIEEKIDGSQFSFGIVDGILSCRSHGAEVFVEAPEKMFKKAVEVVLSVKDILHDGWIYRAEYLQKPKHNALVYSRVPVNHLIIFDVEVGEGSFLPYEEKAQEAKRLGFEIVPLITYGIVDSPGELVKWLATESILGGTLIEGIVAKNYAQFGLDKKVAMGKYVSEAFKEVAAKAWKQSNPSGKDVVQNLGKRYQTEARWQKAILHLREEGKLQGTPVDIGLLFKEVPADLLKEEGEAIKDALFAHFYPQIQRIATAGLAEWYKELLLAESFEASS